MGKTVRLRNRSALFCDPETGFEISGNDVVMFPKRIGSLTRAWLQGGGLLVEETSDAETTQNAESRDAVPDPRRIYSDDEIRSMSYPDILSAVRELGLRTRGNSKKHEHLIEALTEYQEKLRTTNL